jgi:5-hydroxyisourate hydrolase-like protein (transthyretin family)
MAGLRTWKGSAAWLPLALAGAVFAGVAGVFLLGPATQPAHGEPPAPEVTAGFQTTERLTLTVHLPALDKDRQRGTLVVELIGPEGTILDDTRKDVELTEQATSQRFEFAAPKLAADKVTIRCRLDKKEHQVELKKILLVKAHETSLTVGKEFFAGSTAGLRCEVHGVKSISQTVPLAGASVTVQLKNKEGKTFPVFEGKAGADGVANVAFEVPEKVPAGSYKLAVATKSTLGEEKLEKDVTIKSAPRVLLVTDKPLYQPGQLMHIRALALQAFTLHPVGDSDLTFEVEDAKGNKVFKRTQKTSDHGIAAVDFQLADEVNNGDYHVRALLGEHQADKTVTVKPYVLPKFKRELKADKRFYLPKETIHADLQVDYFFGKPVSGGKVKVTASTFDVAFKDFQTWEGKTDAQGHVKFDIKLPDYFVGQPLTKGNALVKLEAKVTDTADHTETITQTYPVSAQPIQVSLIAEGGRLIPDMPNRLFAAAVYPDGSPASKCSVKVWQGQAAQDKPLAEIKTNEAGLAEFTLTPKAGQFRAGVWGQRPIEMLGGQQIQAWGPQQLFDLTAEARDTKGETARTQISLNSEPLGENVLLRLDKAIYKGGEPMQIDIRSSAGMPTVYLDVVKSGQTLLTKWLDVKKGKAEHKLDVPESVFGTLEIHAYQTLASGEIIRDSRVVYVNPAADLKIEVQADKDTYLPGAKGTIRFAVTDSAGQPATAALGVLIVDEAVYALQEMQPGLEKVFFTLQEELLKPQAQAVYKPREKLDDLVREPNLAEPQQQAAQVLQAAVRPKPPAHWEVNPVIERRRKLEEQVAAIGFALWNHANSGKPVLAKDAVAFRDGLLDELVKAKLLDAKQLTDPVGGKLTLEDLARVDKHFTGAQLARALTHQRMQNLIGPLGNYAQQQQAKWLKDGKWSIPETALAEAAEQHAMQASLQDAWGRAMKMVKLDKPRQYIGGWSQWDQYDLVSAGPDGKFGTADDVKLPPPAQWPLTQTWWLTDESRQVLQTQIAWRRDLQRAQQFGLGGGGMPQGRGGGGGFQGGFADRDGARFGAPLPMNAKMPMEKAAAHAPMVMDKLKADGKSAADSAGGPAPPRLREYFPETLLWQPALITDDHGHATLTLDFADSITTWRLTASASSRHGLLGGVSKPLRVFQDFFVDLDLPIALTQNDEVAFPVAVYNYLKTPQTVKLDLQPEPWFELVDGLGLSRSLVLKANEVTSIKFRIRAKKIGHFPLTVKATGTKMSDAIKRGIDVLPDGKKIEQVVTDRLAGTVRQSVIIPDSAIADASRLFVKIYPGVFSQVMEGTEGMLRLPGG